MIQGFLAGKKENSIMLLVGTEIGKVYWLILEFLTWMHEHENGEIV